MELVDYLSTTNTPEDLSSSSVPPNIDTTIKDYLTYLTNWRSSECIKIFYLENLQNSTLVKIRYGNFDAAKKIVIFCRENFENFRWMMDDHLLFPIISKMRDPNNLKNSRLSSSHLTKNKNQAFDSQLYQSKKNIYIRQKKRKG